ncbi:MAG TPA: ATPase domain-containing protein, partial [Gemmatimonadaceae bacterium]|nr:ATPase domain-containing protein [Gemmatimonadaceae bacterium]
RPVEIEKGWASSGSPALDNLLGGGLVRGTSALLTGASGTGKSILATQYSLAAAERGERVAIYLFDERLHTYINRSDGLGLDIRPYLDSGRLAITPLEATEISPGEFASRLTRAADDGAQLVVVDSLNGFTHAMAQEREMTSKIHELLGYLGSRGVTTLLTFAQRGIFGAPADESTDISYLSDAVILLRYFEAQGEVRRAISAVKQRSAANEPTIREFRIGQGGLHLGEPLREFQGVLLGVPSYTGGRAELLRQTDAES